MVKRMLDDLNKAKVETGTLHSLAAVGEHVDPLVCIISSCL